MKLCYMKWLLLYYLTTISNSVYDFVYQENVLSMSKNVVPSCKSNIYKYYSCKRLTLANRNIDSISFTAYTVVNKIHSTIS